MPNGRRSFFITEYEIFSLSPLLQPVTLGYLLSAINPDNRTQRGSLENSRLAFESTKKGRVAFMGGSITEMNGYRPMMMEWLQGNFHRLNLNSLMRVFRPPVQPPVPSVWKGMFYPRVPLICSFLSLRSTTTRTLSIPMRVAFGHGRHHSQLPQEQPQRRCRSYLFRKPKYARATSGRKDSLTDGGPRRGSEKYQISQVHLARNWPNVSMRAPSLGRNLAEPTPSHPETVCARTSMPSF